MSGAFVFALGVAVSALLGARFLMPALPVRGMARRITTTEGVLFVVGTAGLVVHCGAMFFPHLIEPIPGLNKLIDDIRALGVVSILCYVVTAAAVLLGLRRQQPVALTAMALALIAVGVTMYDGGSLRIHLGAIFVSALVLSGTASMLVLPPWRLGADS